MKKKFYAVNDLLTLVELDAFMLKARRDQISPDHLERYFHSHVQTAAGYWKNAQKLQSYQVRLFEWLREVLSMGLGSSDRLLAIRSQSIFSILKSD